MSFGIALDSSRIDLPTVPPTPLLTPSPHTAYTLPEGGATPHHTGDAVAISVPTSVPSRSKTFASYTTASKLARAMTERALSGPVSPSTLERKENATAQPPINKKKAGCWEKIKSCFACLCCCCCCRPSRITPTNSAINQKKLEDIACQEITSKIFTGATKILINHEETVVIPWDYNMVAHELQTSATQMGISGKRTDTAGEEALGRAIVNNYKTLSLKCPVSKQEEEFQKELVYRAIHLVEIANIAQVQGTDNATDFCIALLKVAKNFDGDVHKQIEQIITILNDEELQSRVHGAISKTLCDVILGALKLYQAQNMPSA